MKLNLYANNLVNIRGTVMEPLELHKEDSGAVFYFTYLSVQRLSGYKDSMLVRFPENLIKEMDIAVGSRISIRGQYRSQNEKIAGRNHLKLFVYAMEFTDTKEPDIEENEVFLDGFICKPPVYRKTPLRREITDIIFAVNRPNGESDYIPCICWGRNARRAAGYKVGQELVIRGRIQSREYIKRENGEEKIKTAYEVSVSRVISE